MALPLTLSGLIDTMFPDASPEDRARFWNATRVLAQRGALVPVEDVAGSGRHRRYDPLWVPLARTLLLLKYSYMIRTDILVEIGQFLWAQKDMIQDCPDPVVYYGEFYDSKTQDWVMSFRLVSSAAPVDVFYDQSEGAERACHCVAVAIHRA